MGTRWTTMHSRLHVLFIGACGRNITSRIKQVTLSTIFYLHVNKKLLNFCRATFFSRHLSKEDQKKKHWGYTHTHRCACKTKEISFAEVQQRIHAISHLTLCSVMASEMFIWGARSTLVLLRLPVYSWESGTLLEQYYTVLSGSLKQTTERQRYILTHPPDFSKAMPI